MSRVTCSTEEKTLNVENLVTAPGWPRKKSGIAGADVGIGVTIMAGAGLGLASALWLAASRLAAPSLPRAALPSPARLVLTLQRVGPARRRAGFFMRAFLPTDRL